jgi:DNA-binding beta-propeller fold protein YncE
MGRIARTLLLVPLILLCAAPASAATGDLTFKGCLAKFVVSPCTAVPSEVLDGGRDVAISPDGKLIFVADGNDSVVGFKRSLADGSISYASCVDNSSEPGCTHMSPTVLGPPRSLAFSPDGASLYVLTETTDVVLRFTVGSGGALTLAGCAEDKALPESNCANEVPGLENMLRVVVSPDGASVYVSGEEGAIAHFNAALQLQGCYREVTVLGCGVQAEPLLSPYGMAVSPDGKYLYVTSVGRDAIAWFKREANGALTSVNCISDDDDTTVFSDKCAESSAINYDWPNHIAFSPGGGHAYVTDETGLGVVYHFTRDATTGALARQDCLADDKDVDSPGCTELNDATGSGLASVTDAVVSPDAANLYTVAFQDSALSTFGLASPSGALSHIRCLRANDSVVEGCAPFGSSALSGPFGVAISPDGHDLYVSTGTGGVPALLHFERDAPGTRPGEDPGGEDPGGEDPGGGGQGSTPAPSPGPGPGPAPVPPPDPPSIPNVKCGGLRATIVGTDRADTLRGTAKADVIAARGGNDKVQALGGKDTVCGEAGNDNLAGGAKVDALLGGPGKDTLLGGPGTDRLNGGPGRDTIKQ